MKYVHIILFSCIASFLVSCAQPLAPVEPKDPYAFTYATTVTNGAFSAKGVSAQAEIKLNITSGEDVDYILEYSINDDEETIRISPIWMENSTFVPLPTNGLPGDNLFHGKLFRKDGLGEVAALEIVYHVSGIAIEGISDITFVSDVFYILSQKVKDGRVALPYSDRGTLRFKITPADAILSDIAVEGLTIDKTTLDQTGDGLVSVKYTEACAGKATLSCDWGDGKKEEEFFVAYYPTVVLEPMKCEASAKSYEVGSVDEKETFITTSFRISLACNYSNVDSLCIESINTHMSNSASCEDGSKAFTCALESGGDIQGLWVSSTSKTTDYFGPEVTNDWTSSSSILWNINIDGVKSAGQPNPGPAFWVIKQKTVTLKASDEGSPAIWSAKPATISFYVNDEADLYQLYLYGADISSYAITE